MNTDLLPEGSRLWEGNARSVKENKKEGSLCWRQQMKTTEILHEDPGASLCHNTSPLGGTRGTFFFL